jgi:hypothetical protein
MAARSSTHFWKRRPDNRVKRTIPDMSFLATLRSTSIVLLFASGAAAFTPGLSLVNPRGGQRGTEIEINFHGERLDDLEEALFYQSGLSISDIEYREAGKHAVATLAIAPDAPLGEHSLRLRTKRGVTQLRSFFVGQYPSVNEVEPNNAFEEAQRVELNTTVHGVAGNEDEDLFVVSLKKGQRLSVEVEAMRLGRTMFDAYVAILDPRRFELASCDDATLLRTDAFASILAPEDGDYRVVVREAAYEGNESCQYRLHIGSFPRPSAVYPLGGKPGETIEFTFIGDPGGPFTESITLPSDAAGSVPIFPSQDGVSAPSPHWVQVSPLDHVRESEGNARLKSATAMPPIPSAAHGILGDGQEADWFKFEAKKDENLIITVLARQLRSPLDSVLSLRDADGKNLQTNDDQGGPDSVITWTCPADGAYYLHVRDQLRRTGEDFTYRVEINRRVPSIAATLPTVERVNSQKWKTFSVPRGNRYAAVVNVTRENIGCDLLFEATALPAGITLDSRQVSRSVSSFPVVFEAAANAPISGGLHEFVIRSTGDAPELVGKLTDTIHHIDINNQGPYHSAALDRIATAVVAEAPFTIDLEPPTVPLVRNGTLHLKVRATRDEGYAEKIVVRFLWNPPGVSGPVTLEIPGDQTEILYELNANAEAAVAEWPICVLAEAATPQGPVIVSSGLVPLTVAEPFLGLTFDMGATEQGRATAMIAKLEVASEFEGEAVAEIVGLPHGITAEPLRFTAEMTELTFPIGVAADATVGKHTTLFCRIQVPHAGGNVLHQTGHGGTLRVDAPPPAPVDAPPMETPAVAEATPDAPAEKPLSRLEQLRLRAK